MCRAVANPVAAETDPAQTALSLTQLDFLTLYRADPMERIRLVKLGIPAKVVAAMSKRMAMPKARLVSTLGLSLSTVDRRAREDSSLSTGNSARLLGLALLIGQVQEMVAESGDPEDFDAPAWVARWLHRPLPAFGGMQPAEFMDTAEGQSLVSTTVACMQTGAYA